MGMISHNLTMISSELARSELVMKFTQNDEKIQENTEAVPWFAVFFAATKGHYASMIRSKTLSS